MTSRVAIFLPSLATGGAERMMLNLSAALVRREAEVSLIVGNATGGLADYVSGEVKIFDLGCRRARSALVPLARGLRAIQPDVLVSTLNYANVISVAACRLSKQDCRLVLREANTPSVEQRESHRMAGPLMLWLQRLLYPLADRVVAVSDGVARDLVDHVGIPGGLVEVLENPVITRQLLVDAAVPSGHPWLDEPSCPVILSAGRLTPQKDFAVLVAAFSKLLKKRDVRLIILGEGEQRDTLTSMIESLGLAGVVDLPGHSANPYAFMSKSDLYVLSSRWEGLPNSLIEALACGSKVVATDCPSGPARILDGGRIGDLVPVGDVEALADAMESALDRQHDVEAQIDWVGQWRDDRIASQYLDLFERITHRASDNSRGDLR